MNNSIGMETTHESLYIVHIVTDTDGSLKINKVQDFFDSKVYLECKKTIGEAMAAAGANK
jgi:hypothetical protein